MRQTLIRRSHSVLGAGGRPLATASRFLHMRIMPIQHKRPLAVPWASFATSFSSSPSSSKPPQTFQLISPEELSKLNQTSAALYRLLLKECLRVGVSAGGTTDIGNSPCLLLQEDVNTDEFGKIQPFMNAYNRSARSNNIQQDEDEDNHDDDRAVWAIISFFLRNLPQQARSSKLGSDVLSKLDDSLFYAEYFGDPSDTHYHLSATPVQLVHAVRTAFFRIHHPQDDDDDNAADGAGAGAELKILALKSMTKADIIALHRRAIESVSMLHAQKRLMDCTSVGVNTERGVRVTATSKWKSKGLLSRGAGMERNEEHVFVYRIRIEYIGGKNGSTSGKPIQLLGRRWRITDGVERKGEEPNDDDDDDNYNYEEPDVQVVDAPRTGVVGYHPILHVGDAFEYSSGCNLCNSVGKMEGSYVFCEIEEDDIEEEAQKLGRIGDDLPAFKYEEDKETKEEDDRETTKRFFEVPVAPFVLDASK